jgi:hypothetical protein
MGGTKYFYIYIYINKEITTRNNKELGNPTKSHKITSSV